MQREHIWHPGYFGGPSQHTSVQHDGKWAGQCSSHGPSSSRWPGCQVPQEWGPEPPRPLEVLWKEEISLGWLSDGGQWSPVTASGPAVVAGAMSPPRKCSSCEVPPAPRKEAQGTPEGLLSETVMCIWGNQAVPGLARARYYLRLKCPFSQLPGVLVADSSQLSPAPHFYHCLWLEKASWPKVKALSRVIHIQCLVTMDV